MARSKIEPSYHNETRAVHLLLPDELVSSLDKYRTRYTTRTALIAHAIERYIADLIADSGAVILQRETKK